MIRKVDICMAKYDPIMVNELKNVKLVELLADGEVEVAELDTVFSH